MDALAEARAEGRGSGVIGWDYRQPATTDS